jgi:excisionase family DNA binding protein
MSEDTLLSPEEVAERLGVARLTAVRWMRSGKLKAEKLGRKTVRMKASDLEAFIDQQPPHLTLVNAPAPASTPATEQPFDADTLALMEKLQQAVQARDAQGWRAAVVRLHDAVLQQAVQDQDGQGPTSMAGDTPHPMQYREAMLARLRAMKAEGLSLQKMADRLNNERVPSLKGGRWHKGTIGDMLAQG